MMTIIDFRSRQVGVKDRFHVNCFRAARKTKALYLHKGETNSLIITLIEKEDVCIHWNESFAKYYFKQCCIACLTNFEYILVWNLVGKKCSHNFQRCRTESRLNQTIVQTQNRMDFHRNVQRI